MGTRRHTDTSEIGSPKKPAKPGLAALAVMLSGPASSNEATVCSGVTGTLHTLANEPSVGLYYVVEHIQRSVPALVADKVIHRQTAEALHGADLDAGFALEDMTAATSGTTQQALSSIARMAALATAAAAGSHAQRE